MKFYQGITFYTANLRLLMSRIDWVGNWVLPKKAYQRFAEVNCKFMASPHPEPILLENRKLGMEGHTFCSLK
jgi:hypothetical protein